MKYVTPKEACYYLGVSISILRRWDKEGKIKSIRTPGGQRRFCIQEYEQRAKPTILYARVSSHSQKDDLERQANFCAKHIPMQNLYGRLEADSILGGESLSPFWNEYTKAISDALSAPIPTEPLDSASHLLSGSASKQAANSWFSMNVSSLQSKNSSKISCRSSTVSLLGYTDCENTKSKCNKRYKTKARNQTLKLTPNAVLKIRVYPSKELHRLWKSWLAGYRWVYNWTIASLKSDPNQSAYSLQPKCRNTEKPDWVNLF